MSISELTKQEIGAELTRLASLTGMKLPDDPPLTAKWVQKKFSQYYAVLLRDAFDWYCEGTMDLKSREINAMNISRILHAYMKTSKKRYYEQKPNPISEMVSREKDEEVSKKALKYTAYDYYRDMHSETPVFKLNMMSLITLESYIVSKGWVAKGEITEEIKDELIGKLKRFSERKSRYIAQSIKDKSDFHARAWSGFVKDKPIHDYERAVVTAYLIEKRIEDGWKPNL